MKYLEITNVGERALGLTANLHFYNLDNFFLT